MRIHVFSDIHVRAHRNQPIPIRPLPGVDAVVCAGDVGDGILASLRWLRAAMPDGPIVFVPGNHEYYGGWHPDDLRMGRRVAGDLGITLLDEETAIIGSVRFVGATLWTDYALDGAHRVERAMATAARGLMDHALIRSHDSPTGFFTPQDARSAHERALAFLRTTLADPFDGPTVVVTHHCPDAGGVHERFEGNPLNGAFVSRLDDLVAASGATCWIHGHVHHGRDVIVGATRVICNPYGYPGENLAFDPAFVLEVA